MIFTRKESKASSHSFQWCRVIMLFYIVPHYMHFNVFIMWQSSKYKKQHCIQNFWEVEKNVITSWERLRGSFVLFSSLSHKSLLSTHLDPPDRRKKKKQWAVTETMHTFVWIVHLSICMVVLFVWSLPSRILQMRLCHWGDGPHTGSTAAPELSPSGYTVALRRHLSCSAFKPTTAS